MEQSDLYKHLENISSESESDDDNVVPDIEEIDLESFRDMGFKYVLGNWSKPNMRNYSDLRYKLGNVAIELFMRNDPKMVHLYKNIYKLDQEMDSRTNRRLTPDINYVAPVTGRRIIIDFKTALWELNDEAKLDMSNEVQDLYGKDAIPVFLTLDHTFPRKYKLKKNETVLFMKLISDIFTYLMDNPKLARGEIEMAARFMPHRSEYLKYFEKFESSINLDKPVEYIELKDIIKGIRQEIPKWENFIDGTILFSNEMSDQVQLPNAKNSNVFAEHPWGRDQNRERTSLERDQKMSFGHKANYLMHFPALDFIEDKQDSSYRLSPAEINTLWAAVNQENFTSVFKEAIIETLEINKNYPEIVTQLEELNIIKAYLKTTTSDEYRNTLMVRFNLPNNSTRDLVNYIDKRRESLLRIIKTNSNIKLGITKRGRILIKLNTQIVNKTGVDFNKVNKNRNTKEYGTDKLYQNKDEDTVLCCENLYDFSNIQTVSGKLPKWEPDIKDPYICNESLNTFSNSLNSDSLENINEILTSPNFWIVDAEWTFKKAFIGAIPRVKTATHDLKEISMFTIPRKKTYCFATPHPNDKTTGAVCTISLLDPEKYKKYLQENKKEFGYFPEFCIPHSVHKIGDKIVAISKPFRENLKIYERGVEMVGAYLGVSIMMKRMNIDLYKDWLFTSLFMSYTRQLFLALDLVYLFYKNIFTKFTLGKNEIKKKFEPLNIRDVRVAAIIRNMLKGHKKAIEYVERIEQPNPFKGLIDPIFGFKHHNLQSLLTITYLRQIIPKEDGVDVAKFEWDFFVKELGFIKQWEESPFSKIDPNESLPIEDFFKMLRKGPTTWEPITYHPDTCYRLSELFTKHAMEKDPLFINNIFNESQAYQTGKSSKVLVPVNDKRRPGTILEKKQERRYKGVASVNLTEGLFFESKLFSEHLDNIEKYPESPWKSEKHRYKLGDKGPNLIELATFQSMTYPHASVQTMNLKDERNYAKRNFFEQDLHGRNCNKISDEARRPILKHLEEDIILLPGDEKYIKMEKDSMSLSEIIDRIKLSMDETRYGDTYPMWALMMQVLAMYHLKAINHQEAKFLLYCDELLTGRFIILHADCEKQFKKTRVKLDKEEPLTEVEKKIATTMEAYTSILNDPTKFERFTTASVFEEVKGNTGIKKKIGFTLGVMNMAGSLMTAGHLRLNKLIFKQMGLKNIMKAYGHSDDSAIDTLLRMPILNNIKTNLLNTEDMLYFFKNVKVKLLGNQDTGFYFYNQKKEIVRVSNLQLLKILLITSILCPRLVGQQPSLLKWQIANMIEILQTMMIRNKMVTPLIRYATSIGADLPGHSPAEDLQMAAGRVYNFMAHGGGLRTTNDLILIINYLIERSFGLPTNKRAINKPTQFGGFWYCNPAVLFSSGFSSNEARLWANSKYDERINRHLHFTMFVHEIWSQRARTVQDNHHMLDLATDIDNPEVGGAPEVRKDLKIKYTRNHYTSKSFSMLVKLFKPDLLNQVSKMKGIPSTLVKELSIIQDGLLVKDLNDRWLPYNLSFTQTFNMAVSGFLGKYLTDSWIESYLKVETSLKVVARLGYYKRRFTNPFSSNIRQRFNNEELLSIEDIWNVVNMIVLDSSIQIPDVCLKFGFLAKNIMSFSISEVSGLLISDYETVDIEAVIIPDNTNNNNKSRKLDFIEKRKFNTKPFESEIKLQYFKVHDRREIAGISYRINMIIATYLQMHLYNLKLNETLIAKLKPEILIDDSFLTSLDLFSSKIHNAGFTPQDVKERYRLIIRLLNFKDFKAVLKLGAPVNPVEQALTILFDQELELKANVIISTSHEFEKRTSTFLELNLSRIFVVGLLYIQRNNYIGKDIRVLKNTEKLTLKKHEDLFLSLSDGLRGRIATDFLVSVLYEQYKFNLNILKLYRNKKLPFAKFGLKYIDYHILVELQYKRIRRDGPAELQDYKIYVNTESSEAVKSLIFLAFYFNSTKDKRINQISDLPTKNEYEGDFSIYKNTVLQLRPKGNTNIFVLNDDDMLQKFVTSDFMLAKLKPAYYVFEDEQRVIKQHGVSATVNGYYVSPWVIGKDPLLLDLYIDRDFIANDSLNPFLLEDIDFYLCYDGKYGEKLEFDVDNLYTKIPFPILKSFYELFTVAEKKLTGFIFASLNNPNKIQDIYNIRRLEVYTVVPFTILLDILYDFINKKAKKEFKNDKPKKLRRATRYKPKKVEEEEDHSGLIDSSLDPNNNNVKDITESSDVGLISYLFGNIKKTFTLGEKYSLEQFWYDLYHKSEHIKAEIERFLRTLPIRKYEELPGSHWASFSFGKMRDFQENNKLNADQITAWGESIFLTCDESIEELVKDFYEDPLDWEIERDFRKRFIGETTVPLSVISAYVSIIYKLTDVAEVLNNKNIYDIIPLLGKGTIDGVFYRNIFSIGDNYEKAMQDFATEVRLV